MAQFLEEEIATEKEASAKNMPSSLKGFNVISTDGAEVKFEKVENNEKWVSIIDSTHDHMHEKMYM